MLCVFEPLCLYFLNAGDYIFDVYTLFPVCLVLWLLATAVGCIVFFLVYRLGPKLYKTVLYLVFSLFLCLYVQGNFFAKGLATLDGRAIDWQAYKTQNVQSVLLWIGLFTVCAVLFYKLSWEKLRKLVQGTVSFFLLIFIFTALVEGYLQYGFDRKASVVVTAQGLTEYGEAENFILLVVDMVDAEYENEVLAKYPEDRDFLRDFTYYDNVVSGYCYTENALPFLLSSKWYEGREKFDSYKEWCFLRSPLIAALKERGYDLGIYTDELPPTKAAMELDNTTSISRTLQDPVAFSKAWMRLVGYKYLPFPLKRYSQVQPSAFTTCFSDRIDGQAAWDFYSSNALFYKAQTEEHTTLAGDGRPRFKMIHIQGAHHPYAINRQMEDTPYATYMDCVEGSNTILRAFLERLQADGIYDNSVIVIIADHGVTDPDYPEPMGHQDPVLFIKGAGEQHSLLQTNSAPISQEDLAEAYLKLLAGSAGDNLFPYREGDVRERRCLVFQNGEYDEYIQTGQASDLSTFQPTGKIYLPYR